MSYILEALKKSECERGQGTAPGVQTIHSASLNYRSNKRQLWPYVLITAVALNLAALLYFIVFDEQQVSVAAMQQPQPSPKEMIAETEAVITQKKTLPATTTEPVSDTVTDAKPKQAIETNAAVQQYGNTVAYNQPQVINIRDLPLDIQQQIPAMKFSAHVYSSNPTQRSVVINNRFMEEGEEVTDGMILNEITRDGIIFDYMGYRISTSVITNWDIN